MTSKTLYRVKTKGLGTFMVVATTFDGAANYLTKVLIDLDYGYYNARKIENIEVAAEQQVTSDGKMLISDVETNLLIAE